MSRERLRGPGLQGRREVGERPLIRHVAPALPEQVGQLVSAWLMQFPLGHTPGRRAWPLSQLFSIQDAQRAGPRCRSQPKQVAGGAASQGTLLWLFCGFEMLGVPTWSCEPAWQAWEGSKGTCESSLFLNLTIFPCPLSSTLFCCSQTVPAEATCHLNLATHTHCRVLRGHEASIPHFRTGKPVPMFPKQLRQLPLPVTQAWPLHLTFLLGPQYLLSTLVSLSSKMRTRRDGDVERPPRSQAPVLATAHP